MQERYIETRKLWVPRQKIELHEEYPVPNQSELRDRWQRYIGEGQVVDAPGVYGVMRVPSTPPIAYASIDVCEVLRRTHENMRLVEEPTPRPLKSIHAYGEGLSFEGDSTDITSILQVLMTNKLVEPVDDVEEIAKIMQGWRKDDIYVFANTSTLPGCEAGTIDFFSEHLPGALDGLLLPRNHDGKLPMTKGLAAKTLIETIPPVNGEIVAIKIDDSPHHNISFRDEVGSLAHSQVRTFLPEYPTHYPIDAGSIITPTPLEAFRGADVFLRDVLQSDS